MRRAASILAWILLLLPPAAAAGDKGDFLALCYHDVQDVVNDPEGMAVSTANLAAQFQWLAENHFHPVSLDQLMAAAAGKEKLPANPVLLTFDDGFRSFYTRVYPLLRLFRFPAVLSLVGSWQEVPAGKMVNYGGKLLPREQFVTWKEVREMVASGLVEVGSHSYDLHHGVPANPQGNLQPALSTRIYDPGTGTYESDEDYRRRLRRDLAENRRILLAGTGKPPRIMTWPYGKYTLPALEIARSLGMTVTLALKEERPNRLSDLSVIHRRLVYKNPKLSEFAWTLRHPFRPGPKRFLFLDLDSIFSVDRNLQEKKLGVLLDRVKELAVNRVCLKAWWDREGDGKVDALFFPNRALPVRADLLNRAAWQLWTRSGVEVYVELPPAPGFALPFPEVEGIFEDLGKYADFSGLLLPPGGKVEEDARLAARTRIHLPELFLARRLPEAAPARLGAGERPSLPGAALPADTDLFFLSLPTTKVFPRGIPSLAAPWFRLPRGRDRLVFLVEESSSARTGLPSARALRLLRALGRAGARNIGYVLPDPLGPRSAWARLFPLLSLKDYPFPR